MEPSSSFFSCYITIFIGVYCKYFWKLRDDGLLNVIVSHYIKEFAKISSCYDVDGRILFFYLKEVFHNVEHLWSNGAGTSQMNAYKDKVIDEANCCSLFACFWSIIVESFSVNNSVVLFVELFKYFSLIIKLFELLLSQQHHTISSWREEYVDIALVFERVDKLCWNVLKKNNIIFWNELFNTGKFYIKF